LKNNPIILDGQSGYPVECGHKDQQRRGSMLYIGCFTYVSGNDEIERHGSFSVLVEAADQKSAEDIFKEKLEQSTKYKYGPAGDVYLDNIIEVENIPKNGIMFFLNEHSGESIDEFIDYLPDSDTKGIKEIEWLPDGEEPQSDWTERTVTPFLVLPEKDISYLGKQYAEEAGLEARVRSLEKSVVDLRNRVASLEALPLHSK